MFLNLSLLDEIFNLKAENIKIIFEDLECHMFWLKTLISNQIFIESLSQNLTSMLKKLMNDVSKIRALLKNFEIKWDISLAKDFLIEVIFSYERLRYFVDKWRLSQMLTRAQIIRDKENILIFCQLFVITIFLYSILKLLDIKIVVLTTF